MTEKKNLAGDYKLRVGRHTGYDKFHLPGETVPLSHEEATLALAQGTVETAAPPADGAPAEPPTPATPAPGHTDPRELKGGRHGREDRKE